MSDITKRFILEYLNKAPRGSKTELANAMGISLASLLRYLKRGDMACVSLDKAIRFIKEKKEGR